MAAADEIGCARWRMAACAPSRWARSLGSACGALLPTSFVPVQALAGAFGVSVFAFHLVSRSPVVETHSSASAPPPWLAVAVGAYVAVQLLMPLRHFAIAGNVAWTDEGQRFAWHMLLNNKRVNVVMEVTDPATGEVENEPLDRHLSNYQIRKLRSPDQIVQLAHLIERYYRRQGFEDVEVRAITRVSLNWEAAPAPDRPERGPDGDLTAVHPVPRGRLDRPAARSLVVTCRISCSSAAGTCPCHVAAGRILAQCTDAVASSRVPRTG